LKGESPDLYRSGEKVNKMTIAARILPFVYGILQRPQTTPLLVGGAPISSDELNLFVARRRGSLSAPRTSVLAARALWALSEGKIFVSYLPSANHPKIMISVLAGGASIATGRAAVAADVERILLDVDSGRVYNDHETYQSPATAALFAALDLYDRRRGIDFAPAYLSFLRAKEAGAGVRETLLAAADELLVSMLNDYETDRVPSQITWHATPRGAEFARMNSDKVLDISSLMSSSRELLEHRPDMERYIPRRAILISPIGVIAPEDEIEEPIEESDHVGMGMTEPEPRPEPVPEPEPLEVLVETDPDVVGKLVADLGVSEVAAKMLSARGFNTAASASQYLRPRGIESHDPYDMKGMFECAARLHRAVGAHEKIVIFGDYDADGIPGTSLLLTYLRSVGADVTAVIPEREGGYGLILSAAQSLRQEHAPDLVVTVDCGSSDHEAIAYLNGEGIDVLVTDHHLTLNGLPPTPYFINPNRSDGDPYPFHGLCGAGVAYKLVQAIAKPREGELFAHIPELYDFVMISTVADQVPLTGENRFYVRAGLARVNSRSTGNIGLWAVAQEAGIFLENLDALDLGWKIAPRINAVGRMGTNPTTSVVELLTTSDHDRASELAKMLNKDNGDRQSFTDRLYEQAQMQLGDNPRDDIIGVHLAEASAGVAGLVAAKISERYRKPVLLVNSQGRGSGRAPAGQQIISYMEQLRAMGIFGVSRILPDGSKMTPGYGGHSAACGFYGVEIEPFLAAVHQLHNTDGPAGGAPRRVDAVLALSDVTLSLAEELKAMGPYGEGNPEPAFAIGNLEVVDAHPSKSGHSLLFSVTDGERIIKSHWFGGGKTDIDSLPARVDILGNPVRDRSGAVGLAVTALKPSKIQPPKRVKLNIDPNQTFFVIATRKRSGKSAGGKILGRILGLAEIGTSTIINEFVERDHGLAAGTVRNARDLNPEAYRRELIATGDRMDTEGLTAGIIGLQRDFRVVEGIRRAGELRKSIAYARERYGLAPYVICLENPDASFDPTDNTEAAGLRALADVVIPNDPNRGSLDELEERLYQAVLTLNKEE